MKKRWQVFRTGKHTDSIGREFTVTKEVLEKIAEATRNYAYQNDEYPITIGHVKTGSPSWGWLNKADVIVDGDKLFVEYEEKNLVKEFVAWVNKKLYKTVSIGLKSCLAIDHLAFLGAEPPAVTGMEAISFTESDEILSFEFAAIEMGNSPFSIYERIFRNIKNFLIELKGIDTANSIISEDDIKNAGRKPFAWHPDPKPESNFSEKNKSGEKMLKQKTDTTSFTNNKTNGAMEFNETNFQALLKKNEELMKVNEDSANKIETVRAEQKRTEFMNFCESDEMKKRITPAERENVVDLCCLLDQSEYVIEFQEGDVKKEKTPLEVFKGMLKKLPEHNFSEVAVKEGAPENNNSAIQEADDIAGYANS